MPHELLTQIGTGRTLCVAEEHVRRGGLGSELALWLADQGMGVQRFVHLYARAHHYERYGSQVFLRQQSGLDAASMLDALAGS